MSKQCEIKQESNMASYVYLGLFVVVVVVGAQEVCRDIDPQACQVMQTQNPEICYNQAVSTTACPKYCKKCNLTCYSCPNTVSNLDGCNTTKACQTGELCLTQRAIGADGIETFMLSCAKQGVCDGIVGKRDLSIKCCSEDLCNGQNTTTTTVTVTTSTSKMPSSTATATSMLPKTTTMPPVVMTAAPKQHCTRDLIFVVDDSTTMSLVFSNVKQFMADLVSKLEIGPSDVMVSMVTYDVVAHNKWNLNRYSNKEQLVHAILSIVPSFITIGDALAGLSYVVSHSSQSAFGNRLNTPDVVILISDGSWHGNLLSFITGKNDQQKVIRQLHAVSNNVIAVGIGPVNVQMIHSIATDYAHSFKVHQAIDLLSVESQVLSLICQH